MRFWTFDSFGLCPGSALVVDYCQAPVDEVVVVSHTNAETAHVNSRKLANAIKLAIHFIDGDLGWPDWTGDCVRLASRTRSW